MYVVYDERHRMHHGQGEAHEGGTVPCFENPERAQAVVDALRAAGSAVHPPRSWGRVPLERVHAGAYLDFLEHIYADWAEVHPGTDALPYAIRPHGAGPADPRGLYARLGHYALDTVTPITSGTWEAVTAAADVSLTAMEHVARTGAPAFALTRPPGHHAFSDRYGGYCYLNNAAIAAQGFVDAGAERVAVLDVDVHHGNGTQQIFYDRSDVLFVSLHADPRDLYPYFWGTAGENGVGAGEGYTLNLPLPVVTGWAGYLPALSCGLDRIRDHAAEAVVVSLGLDTSDGDPLADFQLGPEAYARLGERLADLRLPTLFVLEGGYDVSALGADVCAVLGGFERKRLCFSGTLG